MILTTEQKTIETKTLNHEAIAAYIALTKLRSDIGNIYVHTNFFELDDYEKLVDAADKACMKAVDAMTWDEYQVAKAMLEIVHKQPPIPVVDEESE